MIVNDMLSSNRRLYGPVSAAHVVEVPLQLAPLDFEGGMGLRWTKQEEQERLVPRTGAGNFEMDGQYVRLPYQKIVLFNPRESGCVLLEKTSGPSLDRSFREEADTESLALSEYMQRHHPEVGQISGAIPMDAKEVEAWHGWLLVKAGELVLCLVAWQSVVLQIAGGLRVCSSVPVRDCNGPALKQMNSYLCNGWGSYEMLQRTESDYELDRNNVVLASLAALNLLNCRNVVEEEIRPARQQRRAAERAGLPLLSWHVLRIRSSAARLASAGTGDPLALHWTRGHFKDYREGQGLFGRQRGLYWWSPHLSGRADRLVVKSYQAGHAPEPERTA